MAALALVLPWPALAQRSSLSANRLTYLDGSDPFYPGGTFPKLTTPQWFGEPGVDAVVILAIDDMMETGRYEQFLRPILERLEKIDGSAHLSIMTVSVPAQDSLLQKWLKEGVSLEVHTLKHPCPLLAEGNFEQAARMYHQSVDLPNSIPDNHPVAFRMPCCDSMNSPSPRFYAEIFNGRSPSGNFTAIDSSVMNRFTSADAGASGVPGRFEKYYPAVTNNVTKVSLAAFGTTIENYPFPYVIGKLCWEFPCAVPSDWEAYNTHGATNAQTVTDWKAALDATVVKQGVMDLVFHPHGWIRNDQIVEFIDYAVAHHGRKVRFLNFKEAYERLSRNLLAGQTLRNAQGADNGVRLLDLNGDGFLDVVIGNSTTRLTRIWDPSAKAWKNGDFPCELISADAQDLHVQFGLLGPNQNVVAFYRNEKGRGAWSFSGVTWHAETNFFNNLKANSQPVLTSQNGLDTGVRVRDLDNDGTCELIVGNPGQNAIFEWSEAERSWKKAEYDLPKDTCLVDKDGLDNGVRFVDLNGDGYDDLFISNEREFAVRVFIAKKIDWLGIAKGWSYEARHGFRTNASPTAPMAANKNPSPSHEIPSLVRAGTHRNNGSWFHNQNLFVQNEDTASLPNRVLKIPFKDLLTGGAPEPKTPAQGVVAFRAPKGFKAEVVASESLIVDPVAFDWSADGRLWVVEMRDYPLGMDGKGKAGGVVRVLEDTHGDGHYDKGTTFVEGLKFPNGIMPWRKGVLISAAPDIIYAEDTDGDGVADVKTVLYTGFGEGNQQHRINGFEYGLDNWIYLANGGSDGSIRSVKTDQTLELRGHDLRIRPDEGLMELQPGETQFGRHRNDWGDWFGNNNATWGWHYYLPERYLGRNPNLAVRSTTHMLAGYSGGNRVYPHSKAQERFNWPGAVQEVTSACSAMPYRDDLFGPEFESSLFICEPANNLVHREVLEQDGVTFSSHRAANDSQSEFLSSSDNWCRPVMIKTGPDGALYLADMYRLIIEHPEYFPEELRHRPDLRAGEDKGRIYRLYPESAQLRKTPHLDQMPAKELVAALDSPNGWQRDTVQRLLVLRQDKTSIEPLIGLTQNAASPKTRLQALATLEGLHGINNKLLFKALQDPHWAVRRYAIELSEPFISKHQPAAPDGNSANSNNNPVRLAAEDRSGPALKLRLLGMVDDPNIRVRYQLAFSLGELHDSHLGSALASLAVRDWNDEAMQIAIQSSAVECFPQMLNAVLHRSEKEIPPELVESLVNLAAVHGDQNALKIALEAVADSEERPEGAWQFAALCGLLDAATDSSDSKSGRGPVDVCQRFQPIFTHARAVASDGNATEGDRVLATRLLGRCGAVEAEDIQILGRLLGPQNSSGVQQAALARLGAHSNSAAAEAMLAAWSSAGLIERQQILNLLFARQPWVEIVLNALEGNQLTPSELGAVQREKLLHHPLSEIRERAAKILTAKNNDRQKVVASYKEAGSLKGNQTRGHKLFVDTCSICHRLHGEGQTIGPDLGTMANKPIEELLVAILDPNQAVDPVYTSYNLVTKDDRDLTGVLAAETPTSITLKLAGGTQETVLRSKVQSFRSLGKSLMPEGLETALKPQDLADLIAYILTPQ